MRTRALSAALLGVALASAACGTSPTIPPPTMPADSSAPTAAERHADPALEALLPASLGGIVLVRESERGTDLQRQSDALDAMLAGLGKTLADFTLASAYSRSGDLEAQVGVWRVAGATPDRLLPAFGIAVQASSSTKLTSTEIVLGGHDVTQIGAPGELTQGPLYAYAKDDMVLFVQTPDPKLAEQALTAMP